MAQPGMPPMPPNRIPPELVAPVLATALSQTFSQAILFSQLYTYLSSPRVSKSTIETRDSRLKVAYVLLVSGLAAAQTGRYIYLVHLAADDQLEILAVPSRWLEPLLNAVISCLVRLFFIRRTYRMVPRWFLIAPLLITQALILACQIWLTVQVFRRYQQRYIIAGDLAFDLTAIGSLVLDILLATISCICILRSRTGVEYLDRFLRRIILFGWISVIPPVLVMIPAVVIYHVDPNRLGGAWCGCCLAMVAKLYCHSLMRSLNSRERLKGRLQQEREAFTSNEARKVQVNEERSEHSRHGPLGSVIETSLEGGTHTRFSSQTTFCPASPSRARFPAPKSLGQIDEPEQELAMHSYLSNPHPTESSVVGEAL